MDDQYMKGFLGLPLELRLQIYAFAILDEPALTIGIVKLKGLRPDVVHQVFDKRRRPFPGLPEWHAAAIKAGYDPALLSPTRAPAMPVSSRIEGALSQTIQLPHTGYDSLLHINRQIRAELKQHVSEPPSRRMSLFVQYPYGLQVLCERYPGLMHRARSVHLAGTYEPAFFDPEVRAHVRPRRANEPPVSRTQLRDLIKNHFAYLEKFEMRMYFPGKSSYSTIWGDDDSPVGVALQYLGPGELCMEVLRGTYGNGVYLAGSRGEMRFRNLTTKWNRLEEGGEGQRPEGSWVVDCQWPSWKTESSTLNGERADLVVRT